MSLIIRDLAPLVARITALWLAASFIRPPRQRVGGAFEHCIGRLRDPKRLAKNN